MTPTPRQPNPFPLLPPQRFLPGRPISPICQALAKIPVFCQTLAKIPAGRFQNLPRFGKFPQFLPSIGKIAISAIFALSALFAPAAARADGLETFDLTGLRTNGQWVAATNFDGTTEGVAWTATQVRGHPQLRPGDPAIAIRSLDANNKGCLVSTPIPGGIARVTFEFLIASDATNAVADFDVRVGDLLQNVRTNGPGIHAVALDWRDADRRPVTNDCTLSISNRLATSAPIAIDNLAWESPTLSVAIDPPRLALTAEGRPECTFAAAVDNYTESPVSSLSWTLSPDGFTGTIVDDGTSLTLLPAIADEGTAWTLACTAATDTRTASGTAVLDLLDPRFLDFETLSVASYPTNFAFDPESGAIELVGIATNLSGIPWKLFNAQSSPTNAIGAKALRLRHSSLSTPALFESLAPFSGIGSVSFACAPNNPTNWVSFVVETRPAESSDADWAAVAPAIRLEGDVPIARNRVTLDIDDPADLYLRIRTTGGSGRTFNLDDFTVTPHGDLIPALRAEAPPAAAVGRPYTLAFRLLNAEGAPREWTSFSVEPPGPVFAENGDALLLSFTPAEADLGTTYTATAAVSVYAGQYEATATAAFTVARAPGFDLATTNASPLPIGEILDIHMTDLVIDGQPVASNDTARFAAEWTVSPPFDASPTLKQYNRLRYGNAFTPADRGNHAVTLTVTDRSNTLATARTLHFRLFDPDAVPDPRFLDFEDFDLPPATPGDPPATNTLSGAPWRIDAFHADWTDAAPRHGTTAARLSLPAAAATNALESLAPFPGIGYVSFHAAGEGARVLLSVREDGAETWTPLPEIGPLSPDLALHRLYVGIPADAYLSVAYLLPEDAPGDAVFVLDDLAIEPYAPPEAWALDGDSTIPAGGGFSLVFTATGIDPDLAPESFLALRDGWDVTADFAAAHPAYAYATRDEPGGAESTLALSLVFADGHSLDATFPLATLPGGAVLTGFDPAASTVTFNASPLQAYRLFAVTNLLDAPDPAAWIWTTNATGIGATTLPLPDLPVPAAYFGIQTLP